MLRIRSTDMSKMSEVAKLFLNGTSLEFLLKYIKSNDIDVLCGESDTEYNKFNGKDIFWTFHSVSIINKIVPVFELTIDSK